MEDWFLGILRAFSLPEFGLTTVFITSFIAATLIPFTPTPFVMGLVKLNPELFWPTVFVATIGNTLGGMVDWWMGYGAKSLHKYITKQDTYGKVSSWLRRFGPKACIMSWLPVLGDPLSFVAGWLRLPFWPCSLYMFIGRFGRFLFVATLILIVWPGALDL